MEKKYNPYAYHNGQAAGKLMVATDIKLFLENLIGTPEEKEKKIKSYLKTLQESLLSEYETERKNFEDYEKQN